ncbi:A24 family peptidase [Zavarzinella formosa]|uniref:A24 family peptidase n=1 Tax=Zavarzinella formosa TaxID=360055 RepID=UPI0003170C3C|nr:A24 family peptidase [Zavarzinella formosa]
MTTMMESHTGQNSAPAPNTNPDDLGIDRAFVMSMARIPFIAVIWTMAAYASHLVWAAFAPADALPTSNYGPLVVLCFGMVLAAVIDGWAFKVPNWLTLSLVVSGWALGGLHTAGIPVDAGTGGIGNSLLCTMVGFFLLFPLLAIVGMGQGDVKMLMGFGSWIGAFFGGANGVEILIWAFALGAITGGLCGLVMMATRRKFKKNLSNFREIAVDLKVLATVGPNAAASRSSARRPGWDRLPYGIPLCVGFLGYLAYLYMQGTLPGMWM